VVSTPLPARAEMPLEIGQALEKCSPSPKLNS